jgi:alkanesulfonate monooxygenase SsuD/methylene tetrahydromethanopterin reductase-like flavin-dependent oxidoreductase (luciferase family)
VFPPIEAGEPRTWIVVGATLETILRAARHDFPLMIAVIGGDPPRFKPFVDLYHDAFEKLGRPARAIGIHSVGYIAETDSQVHNELWPDYKLMRDRIGVEHNWPPIERAQFDLEAEKGSLYVGSPATVADKIAATMQVLGATRFDMRYAAGTLPHEKY